MREEKSKAKEEADDLAQEMAELRYQMTGLLEEECKRRACIEQASLQRISELEAQVLMVDLQSSCYLIEAYIILKVFLVFPSKIERERRKFFAAVGHLHEAA